MSIDTTRLDAMKSYLRIDEDMVEEDELLQRLMASADEYIRQQTGKTQVKSEDTYVDIHKSPLYNQTLQIIVSHWYENRGIQTPGSLTDISYSAEMLLSHIAMSGEFI